METRVVMINLVLEIKLGEEDLNVDYRFFFLVDALLVIKDTKG